MDVHLKHCLILFPQLNEGCAEYKMVGEQTGVEESEK